LPQRSPARKVSIEVYVDTGCHVRTRSGPSANERSGLTPAIGLGFDAPSLVNGAGRYDSYMNVADYQTLVDRRAGTMAGNCAFSYFLPVTPAGTPTDAVGAFAGAGWGRIPKLRQSATISRAATSKR
jgi:hypothetical protein